MDVNPQSKQVFKKLQTWIDACDKHSECKQPHGQLFDLPKRLLDLSDFETGKVKLVETKNLDSREISYIALSHRWGPRDRPPLCSTKVNIKSHEQNGILLKDLPKNFRDTALVCHELDIDYLWIDCLCILQGPGGDFDTEMESIETTYANAYCVIAACNAKGAYDGFLKDRLPIQYVRLPPQKESTPELVMCENPDNFERDVIQSGLSQRGWVFQEHALARRTLFFTDKQVYFECGNGIWCETLTRLKKYV